MLSTLQSARTIHVTINSTSIPLFERNGEINRHEIRLIEEGDSKDRWIVNVTGNLTKTFSGLKSFTFYSVSVRAATLGGSGPWSSAEMLRTISEGKRETCFKGKESPLQTYNFHEKRQSI